MGKAKDTDIPISLLRECFVCQPMLGALIWRWRPSASTNWNARLAGKRAGYLKSHGGRSVEITIGGRVVSLEEHRIIWAMANGRWPAEEIDHINGIRDDNRLENLREASRSENQHNLAKIASNTSGFPGVSWNKRERKWMAQIRIGRRTRFLGHFDDPKTAHQAYLQAKAELHPFAPKVRSKHARVHAPLSGFVTDSCYVIDQRYGYTTVQDGYYCDDVRPIV
jgi:hypothetical protein